MSHDVLLIPYTCAKRSDAATMKSTCNESEGSNFATFGQRLGPDQNGCPEVLWLSEGGREKEGVREREEEKEREEGRERERERGRRGKNKLAS